VHKLFPCSFHKLIRKQLIYVVRRNNLHKLLNTHMVLIYKHFVMFIISMHFLFCRQMGQSLPNEKINSYYKGYPMFEDLIELRLFWFINCIHDWDDVVKMLPNCPKLQALSISKVCWSPQWIVIYFCWFFFSILLKFSYKSFLFFY
jgi:hypothetical protein